MGERTSPALTLTQIIETHQVEIFFSYAKDHVKGEILPVISKVYRNDRGKIVYVGPHSIEWHYQSSPQTPVNQPAVEA